MCQKTWLPISRQPRFFDDKMFEKYTICTQNIEEMSKNEQGVRLYQPACDFPCKRRESPRFPA